MTLPEAVEQLTLFSNRYKTRPDPDLLDAIKLVINATRKLQNIRILFPTLMPGLLPGEDPMPDLSPSADRKQLLRESPLGRECGQ
ncbi:unnamed protein product [marine sediment metagenome]|uniref:Uncharacterized protein n=1 Tax=marine sediment metagenome TaxID=412755 RepID=X1RFG5_9ZZZZ